MYNYSLRIYVSIKILFLVQFSNLDNNDYDREYYMFTFYLNFSQTFK